jgi:hypothetical protein
VSQVLPFHTSELLKDHDVSLSLLGQLIEPSQRRATRRMAILVHHERPG